MPSPVAIETISAHETTLGQAFSSSSFMKSILLKTLNVWNGFDYNCYHKKGPKHNSPNQEDPTKNYDQQISTKK